MPHLFRTRDGTLWRPRNSLSLTLSDGVKVEGVWAGSAKEEKLTWWLRKPGNQLAQTDEISEVAIRADDTGETVWGAAPGGARLLFVVEAPAPGKNYRLAKMVTTAATPDQVLHFRHERFSLFGSLKPDGTFTKIPPAPPSTLSLPVRPVQGDLL